jgi:hypothetical protein
MFVAFAAHPLVQGRENLQGVFTCINIVALGNLCFKVIMP